jgi:hypothetical protein
MYASDSGVGAEAAALRREVRAESAFNKAVQRVRKDDNITIPSLLSENCFSISKTDSLEKYRPKTLPERKKMSTLGRQINVEVNSYMVRAQKLTDGKVEVYRYDIKYEHTCVPRPDKEIARIVKEKIWASSVVQKELKGPWLYDGNNLAW